MSFWAGVVQGVKDIDVLKEKEALAEERKAAAEKAEAWQLKTFEYGRRRDEAADAYRARTEALALEDRAWTRAQAVSVEVDAANAVLGGTRPSAASSGGGGGGSVPAANDIRDSNIQLKGWAEAQLKDETISPEDADYVTGVVNSFTDPKDAHEFWTLYTGIRESTGQVPTVEQLRNTIRVTQVPGYADNRKQAEELLATIHGIDKTTPEGLLQVRTLRKQLENIDLNAATIDADTSSYVTSEERPKLYEDQAETFETELTTNWLSEPEQNALESAPTPAAATILMSRYRTKYGAQALATLKSEYPREFREAHGNPAFRGIASTDAATTTTGSGGTEGGTTTISAAPGDTPATLAEKQRRMDAVIANPDDPEAIAQANEAFGADEVARLRYVSSFEPSGGFRTGELEGGAYSIPSVSLEYEGGRDQEAPDTGDVAGGFATRTPYTGMSLKDSAAELARLNRAEVTDQDAIDNLIEYMNETWKPEDVRRAFEYFDDQGPLPTPSTSPEAGRDLDADNLIGFNPEDEGYRPAQMGATELNLPKVLEALSPETRKIVEAELQLTPGDTNLGRMEQSRLGRVGMESDRLSTESKSMPNGYTPTQMGATELNSPKVRSALDTITAEYVEAKGAPLAPEEELAVGIEAIVDALTGGGMDQGDLNNLIIELNTKYGEDKVREALNLAMNP